MMQNSQMHFADDLLWFKKVCQEDMPKGLSITWHGKLHLWPIAYRPANETFEDTMRYTISALTSEGARINFSPTPDMQQKALDAVKD